MERVFGWSDGEGAILRPTGMVVFATLDPRCRHAVQQRPREIGLEVRRAHVSVHEWRRRAVQSMAWLLGRQ